MDTSEKDREKHMRVTFTDKGSSLNGLKTLSIKSVRDFNSTDIRSYARNVRSK